MKPLGMMTENLQERGKANFEQMGTVKLSPQKVLETDSVMLMEMVEENWEGMVVVSGGVRVSLEDVLVMFGYVPSVLVLEMVPVLGESVFQR